MDSPIYPEPTNTNKGLCVQVVKRDGSREDVKLDKLTARVKAMSKGLNIDPLEISKRCASGLHDGISSKRIDDLLATTAAGLTVKNPDYSKVAARILATRHHKETNGFYEAMKVLGKEGILTPDFMELVKLYGKELEETVIDYRRDLLFTYFGYQTLYKKYLRRIKDQIVERPQDLFMRVALANGRHNLEEVKALYEALSLTSGIFGTPNLMNAGTKRAQMSSCFLLGMSDDSIPGIYDTLKDCALISQSAGGIGIHASNIRAKGSLIRASQRKGSGIIPMLKNFDDTAAYVDQGGARPGAFAIYLEPWHPDILDFLSAKDPTSAEERRLKNLFLALWVNDLFMERVSKNEDWSLFCPSDCPDLQDLLGDEFKAAYEAYEAKGLARHKLPARDLYEKIILTQIKSGQPYIGFKDHANKKSNQKNLGTIKSSNLCIEVVQYSDKNETAVCNLASMALPTFVQNGEFQFKSFGKAVEVFTRALNNVIDITYYPIKTAEASNKKHRPIGLGVQGLADVFMMLDLPYSSAKARELNKDIFECMYYHALKASLELAKRDGKYSSFDSSPAAKGELQFDLWGVQPSENYDWSGLKEEIKKHGLRNSLLIALMPTASTSQILGNTESFEPLTSNIYSREINGGDFIVVNEILVKKLQSLNLWIPQIIEKILANNGSIQSITEIPESVRDVFKTVWEIKQKDCLEMAADRGAYVCQSQSMNLWMAEPDFAKISSAIMTAWKLGLKTGNYYVRIRAGSDAAKIGQVALMQVKQEPSEEDKAGMVCSLDNPGACEACSS